MKLLDKKIVNIQVNEQKAQQIREGIKIAEKVDGLRGEMNNLKRDRLSQLELGRKEFEKEMKPLIDKLTRLKEEIKLSEEKKAELKKPLIEEWNNIEKKTKELEKREEEFNKEKEDLKILFLQHTDKDNELKKRESKLSLLEKETNENAKESRKNREESELILGKSNESKVNQEKSLAEEWSKLNFKKEEVDFQKQSNETMAGILKEREFNISNKEREINDKYATLERTINRTNGQR